MLAIGCCDKSSSDFTVPAKISGNTSPVAEKEKILTEEMLQIWWGNEKLGKYEFAGKGSGANHLKTITDVAWAPFIGRSYHILASISQDMKLILWKITNEINKENELEISKMEILKNITIEAIVFFHAIMINKF